MERSFSRRKVADVASRVLRIAGGGLVALLISALLIAFRIVLSDETDILWDHPSMFPDVVAMAYEPTSGSEWGILWDMLFLVVPMLVYATMIAPGIWEAGEDDRYSAYPTYPEELAPAQPEADAPELTYYAEMHVLRPVRSKCPTLPGGFDAPAAETPPADEDTRD